jgi:hypothetical protein
MNYWKIFCQETENPGLWPRWFKSQCAAIGWPPKDGYTLEGKARDQGWAAARNALKRVKPGDLVVVQLRGCRVGGIGEVVRKEIGDHQWKPTVHPSKAHPWGGKGRRILVRWDLNVGPASSDKVVSVPPDSLPGQQTICQIDSKTLNRIKTAMQNEANWVGLQGRFDYERSLSDWIATYPHRLEDDLMPFPNAKVREKVFPDRTRSDVLLIDGDTPVVVECKQGAPTLENIKQLRGYLRHVRKETGKKPRGILVHGGGASLRNEVRREVERDHSLKVIRYSLHVDFAVCN